VEDLFNIAKLNKTAPAKGKFLISEPFMEDNFFKRSVVFLCDHNEDGSFGFVLNNILSINMKDVMEGFEECEFEVGFGGPVNSSNLYYIHTLGDMLEGSITIQKGLYTGGDFEKLQSLINSGLVNQNQVRFFLGYSGWTAGQLEQEIKDSAWIVTNSAHENIINAKDKELWKNLLNEMGGKFKAIANFPEDPSLN
jgi:putative transcriptional regulator